MGWTHIPSLLRHSERGMTLLEALVASTLSLLIVGMTVSATTANRAAFAYDAVRTNLNQNLRGATDVVAAELRQAGERLPPGFPAIEITNGTPGDTLIVRRNLINEVLTLCQALTTTSTTSAYITSTAAGRPPACTFGSQTVNYNAWSTYRLAQAGYTAPAYIYDFSTRKGQFFTYSSENTSGSVQRIIRSGGSWTNAYTAYNSAIYIMREWKFSLSTTAGQSDLLQVYQDGATTPSYNVAFGLATFQIRALMQDGTSKTSFTNADSWTLLSAVELTATGSSNYRERPITSTLVTRVFPRNILSN